MKERIDKLLVTKKIIPTRQKAMAFILAGNVRVNGQTITKPSTQVDSDSQIDIVIQHGGFVSRGGIKLQHALEFFKIDVTNYRCLDIGASTGGFTDCLLKRGAQHVVALDVGKNQIDYGLRKNENVTVIEGFNARFIDHLELPWKFNLVTIDVSFISLKYILIPLRRLLQKTTYVVALIKPQFELLRPYRGFKGVVFDSRLHLSILKDLNEFFLKYGYNVYGYTFSPIRGPKGNIEYFVHMKWNSEKVGLSKRQIENLLNQLVVQSHRKFELGKGADK